MSIIFFYLPITALFFLNFFIFILKLYIYFSSFARRTSKARDFSSKPGSHFVRAMREWVFEKSKHQQTIQMLWQHECDTSATMYIKCGHFQPYLHWILLYQPHMGKFFCQTTNKSVKRKSFFEDVISLSFKTIIIIIIIIYHKKIVKLYLY